MSNNIITIGRSSDCQIVVGHEYDSVSNNHALIEYVDGCFWLVDMSTNGTVVNQEKVHNRKIQVFHGDTILLAGIYKLDWECILKFFPNNSRRTMLKSNSENQNTGRATIKFNNKSSRSEDKISYATSDINHISSEHMHKTEDDFTKLSTNKKQWHWLCYVLLGILLLPNIIMGLFFVVLGFSIGMPEITIATIYAFFCVFSLVFRKKKISVFHGITMVFLVSMGLYAQSYCEEYANNYGSVNSSIAQEAIISGLIIALLISIVLFALLRTTLCVKYEGIDAWSVLKDDALIVEKKYDWVILITLVVGFMIFNIVHLYNIAIPDA